MVALQSTLPLQVRPALDPVHDTQAVFRVVLEALSQPAVWRQLPISAAGAPANPWIAAVLLTLLDHETSFAALVDAATEEFVRARTNARRSSPTEADFVLGASASLTARTVLDLRRGTLEYPDDSTTLVVDTTEPDNGARLTLRGPGIPGTREAHIGLGDEIVAALREANSNYPCGVDVLVVDATGRLLGLPRTTGFGEA